MELTLYIIAVGIPIAIGEFWMASKQLEAEKAKKARGDGRNE
jgi:hypothetical protein